MNVGDFAQATRDIWQDTDDDSPLMLLAERGTLLQVRRVGGGAWPLYVGHPSCEHEAMFGVQDDEIQPVGKG